MKLFIALLVAVGIAGIIASALWWDKAIYLAMAIQLSLVGMKISGGFRRRP